VLPILDMAGTRRMDQRHGPLPTAAEHLYERRRRDQHSLAGPPRGARLVAPRRPPPQLLAEDEVRLLALQDEGAVRQRAERRAVESLFARTRQPPGVKLFVERVGAPLVGMELAPDLLHEPHVVLAPAERARPVPGGEGSRLVEEEELRELARLHQRCPVPAAELDPAGDPAPR